MPWQKILTLEVTHTLPFLLLLFLIIIILRNDGKAAPWQLNVNKLIPKRKDHIVHKDYISINPMVYLFSVKIGYAHKPQPVRHVLGVYCRQLEISIWLLHIVIHTFEIL